MNILITGATGFIGRHLTRVLAVNHTVFGMTRTATMQPATPALPVVINLSVPNFVEQLPSNIDCLIHLAQSVKYHEFPEGVHDMTRVNINATVELLEWARLSGVKHFVFTSTANVYDETSEVLTEAHPTDPKSFYGASKLCAEHLLRQYQKFFELEDAKLEFTDDALKLLAQKALQRATGARALRSITEELMVDMMYHLPEKTKGATYTINREVVEGKQNLFEPQADVKKESA